jgi:hypothetical protein
VRSIDILQPAASNTHRAVQRMHVTFQPFDWDCSDSLYEKIKGTYDAASYQYKYKMSLRSTKIREAAYAFHISELNWTSQISNDVALVVT